LSSTGGGTTQVAVEGERIKIQSHCLQNRPRRLVNSRRPCGSGRGKCVAVLRSGLPHFRFELGRHSMKLGNQGSVPTVRRIPAFSCGDAPLASFGSPWRGLGIWGSSQKGVQLTRWGPLLSFSLARSRSGRHPRPRWDRGCNLLHLTSFWRV